MSAARLINAVFPGKCYACGASYGKEAPIYYAKSAPKGRKAWCAAHGPHAPRALEDTQQGPQLFGEPAPVPTAGALPVTIEGCTRIAEFDSLSEYLEAAAVPAETEGNRTQQANYLQPSWRGIDWHGITPDEMTSEGQVAYVARLVREGWPRGLAMLEDFARDMTPPAPPVNVRRRRSWGDQGDGVDMGRVWSGDLSRAWSRTTRAASRAPRHYRVHLSPNQPSKMDAECIFWRVVAGVVLSDLLTEAGYSVEICLTYASDSPQDSGDKANILTTCIVKPAGAPLDLAALAVAAHPLMFRAADLSLRCRAMGARRIAENMGYTATPKGIAPQWFAAHPGATLNTSVHDKATARAWIAARLAELENPETLAA